MLLFNAHHEDMQFVLPPPLDRGAWRVQLDTGQVASSDGPLRYDGGAPYPLGARSLAVLVREGPE